MASYNFMLAAVLLAFGLSVIFSAPCKEDFCLTVDCTHFNDCDLIIPQATQCGCCDLCVDFIEEGKPCAPLTGQADLTLPANTVRYHCGRQLVCDTDSKKCVTPTNKPCLKELQKYLKNKNEKGWLQVGKIEPKCDVYGNYEPYQSLPGSMYFCVAKTGTRIFGESLGHEPVEQQCRCSRAIDDLQKAVKHTSLGTWAETQWRKLKHFFRCSATGDYDPLQCVDGKCFCINGTLQQNGAEVNKKIFRRLHCYNPNAHAEEYIRKCEKDLMSLVEQKEALEADGKLPVGFELPECDLDGSYAPKQCISDTCFCADKDGFVIENQIRYSVPRYSEEADAMNCNCAREQLFLTTNRLTKKLKCKENGNYNPKQCLGSLCYCVDRDGNQSGQEFEKTDPKTCSIHDIT